MPSRGRPNRSGIDWNDPDQAKAKRRENTRRYAKEGATRKYESGPVTIDGTEYPSQSAAARARGVSKQAIWQRLNPDWKRANNVRPSRDRRRRTDPRPERTRHVRLSKDDALLVARLLRHFPDCTDGDALVSMALHRLAEHTDD